MFMEVMGKYAPPMYEVLADTPGEHKACVDLGCGSGSWYVCALVITIGSLISLRSQDIGRRAGFPACEHGGCRPSTHAGPVRVCLVVILVRPPDLTPSVFPATCHRIAGSLHPS